MPETERPPSLAGFLRPVRGTLLAAMLLEAAGAVALVVSLAAVVSLGRELLSGGTDAGSSALVAAGVAAAAYLVRVVLLALAATLSHLADADFQLGLRRAMAQHLGRLPLGWFDTHPSGEVRKLATDDVAALHTVVAHSLLDIVGGTVVPVAVFCYLCTVDVGLALLSLLPVVVSTLFYARAMRGASRLMPQFYAAMAAIGTATVEFVRGIAVVRTFGQAGRAHRAFREATDDFNDFYSDWSGRTTRDSAVALAGLAAPASLLVTASLGSVWLVHGWVDPAGYVAFLLMGSALTASLYPLIVNVQSVSNAQVSAAALAGLLATPPLPVPREAHVPDDATLRLEGVVFGYDPERPVLKGVDLELAPGTVTALVGPSGAGKSTLASLLPRFFDVTAGAVRLGGVDLRDLSPADLYARVAFVFQDVSLLRLSVAENIALGRPDATREDVERAARDAAIHDRVTDLPQGYDTVLGEDVQLSGGEAQRVAIARALLTDAPVLVLDEATSYADPDSEAEVQQAISRLVRGRTVLVVAHRLRSVVGADQIVVLDDGCVVQRGRHDELLAEPGLYAELWRASTDLEHGTTATGRSVR